MHEHDIDGTEATRQLQDSNLKIPPCLPHRGCLVTAVGWIFETGISAISAWFRAKSFRPTGKAECVTFPLWSQTAGSSQPSKGTLSRELTHALIHASAITDLVYVHGLWLHCLYSVVPRSLRSPVRICQCDQVYHDNGKTS